jgi:hypothetical protein
MLALSVCLVSRLIPVTEEWELETAQKTSIFRMLVSDNISGKEESK